MIYHSEDYMAQPRDSALIKTITIKIAVSSFLIQSVALYSSELFNCAFNNRFDALGLSLLDRLPYIFKPTVFIVFIGAYIFQLAVILVTLKPMFNHILTGEDYAAARLAAIKLPWRIVILQSATWVLGTTAYFILRKWNPESGIPYPLSVLMKLSTGLMGVMFNCIFANIHLLPAKHAMSITDIREGETDHFTRNKNLFIVFCSTFIMSSHFFYLNYYLLNPHAPLVHPYLSFGLWGFYFIAASIGLTIVSNFEYTTQIQFLKRHISRLLDSEMSAADDKVQLLYFDEVGEFAALFNKFMEKFRLLLDETNSSAIVLSGAVQNLSTTTKEVTSTSNMQAAAVKEVVSTMEDSNTITQSIGKSIPEVTRIALRTKEHVESGMDIVHETADKMTEIRKKNTDTISGIRSLTDKIRAIWEIVDIINTIVEQTRIIAFNAALEASTAGDAGKNFRIVASEIKSLADSTTESTAEIQSRITEIQKAANNLIVVSEEGTERIRQGHELSDKLNSVFMEILDSADISASSSESIENSIRQQASAFEQIVITMKEISRGIDNLVVTQQQTSHTAESLNNMAANLRSQAGKFISSQKAGNV
jgi:methyl-accepting chemotaxis protein